ncbi:hypothetical protein NE626_16240, partial [Intestinimonas massiliensis]|uniref:hypothetical protein n=1 Tax=Intestinimonas massiliensis (ex Afouda et al. 2020) TaxID=1673721 RepID=UPI00210D106B
SHCSLFTPHVPSYRTIFASSAQVGPSASRSAQVWNRASSSAQVAYQNAYWISRWHGRMSYAREVMK